MIMFLLRTQFHDGAQFITVAHEVYKQGTSVRPMAIFLIHSSRIVHEDNRISLAIREQTRQVGRGTGRAFEVSPGEEPQPHLP